MISIKRLGSNCFPAPGKNSNSKPNFNFNGFEYVDLGLPSGTLWAKMNIGASSETDYGLYFAWGETTGYTASQVGTGEGQKAFSWSDYALTEDDGSTMSKYNASDNKTHLELTDDAAAVNMGGDWHMPTKEQCEELFNTTYVTYAWVTNYNGSGINGYLFTSVSNGNTMFIPAAGSCEDSRVLSIGESGCVLTSALGSQNVKYAWDFNFVSDFTSVGRTSRYYGQSVRGVVGQMDEPEAVIPSEPIFH